MEEPRVPRRLAAILAADVVGYSRLVGADELGTIARVKALRRALIDPAVAAQGGRIVKTTGDGILIEFRSAVAAVECAVAVQRGMVERNATVPPDRRIEFRVGVNLGDIVVDGDDILGDGVNVAARLEALAEPGAVCVSGTVHDHVRDKLGFAFADLGERQLKNIARPVHVWRLDLNDPPPAGAALALPDRPSIAVLPFANVSGDPEQEYFADGMVEDIITGLARLNWLFVIARNSSFTYKGKTVDVKQVGRELGVRYVLEGSVRKSGNRVRITGQLIDAASGAHIWADRFEGALEDIFDLQDQFTASVVGAIEPAMRAAEIRRAEAKPTASLDAFDLFLRAFGLFYARSRTGCEAAIILCRKAIAADPRYASAHALAAYCCTTLAYEGWTTDSEAAREEAVKFARQALEFGADDPTALALAGWALGFISLDHDRALSAIERALSLNPNSAHAWSAGGHIHHLRGEGDAAIEYLQRAMRLSPRDSLGYRFKAGMASAHFVEGRYAEAAQWADKTCYEAPSFLPPLRCKIAASALLGRMDEAKEALRTALAVEPDATVTKWARMFSTRRGPQVAAYIEGFRKAGLPE